MPYINQHWYSANEGRAYPIAEGATAFDDNGQPLPANILVDLAVRFPDIYGDIAVLSAIVVTDQLVSLTLVGTESPDGAAFVPLAVVTVRQPVQQNRMYALTPIVPGVGGWVAFGSGVADKAYSGRFSTAEQSRLEPRVARAYPQPPIPSIRSLRNLQPLTGLVSLRAVPPVEITAETREVDNVLRNALVFRLVNPSTTSTATGVPSLGNTFVDLAGPCGGRPESGTCGEPQPIEFINSVGPDCNGRITLDFRGCATPIPVEGMTGAILECAATFADVCPPPFIPDSQGFLPSETDPVVIPATTTTTTTTTALPDDSASPSGDLPYCQCFNDGVAADWAVLSGEFAFVAGDSDIESPYCEVDPEPYAFSSTNLSTFNLAVWNSFEISNLNRMLVSRLMLRAGPGGARHVGGLLLNYRESTVNLGQYVWFAVLLDYDQQEVRLVRFNGTSLVTVFSVSTPGIVLDEYYEIQVEVTPGPSGSTTLAAAIVNVANPLFSVVIGGINVSNYAPSTGLHGVVAVRSIVDFEFWCYDTLEGQGTTTTPEP